MSRGPDYKSMKVEHDDQKPASGGQKILLVLMCVLGSSAVFTFLGYFVILSFYSRRSRYGSGREMMLDTEQPENFYVYLAGFAIFGAVSGLIFVMKTLMKRN